MSDSVTPWTVSPLDSSLSMEFSRQEHWSGLPFSSPDKGRKPLNLATKSATRCGSQLNCAAPGEDNKNKPDTPWMADGVGISAAAHHSGA